MKPTQEMKDALLGLVAQTIRSFTLTPDCQGLWLHFASGSSAFIPMPAPKQRGAAAPCLMFVTGDCGIAGTARPRKIRKPRPDAKCARLSPEQRTKLATSLLDGMTYKEARAMLRSLYGLQISTGALSAFYQSACVPLLLQRMVNASRGLASS
jgi:hypothetical protein